MNFLPQGIFFDLDGTLVDTHDDLRNAANHVLSRLGARLLTKEESRIAATDGMIALLRISLGDRIDSMDADSLKKEFLSYYSSHICVESCPFPGILRILRACRKLGVVWGVVTNKPSYLTDPLLDSISEFSDRKATVCSDSIPEKKPHPAPFILAAKTAGCDPTKCIYVGDHARDIECGNNAGAYTIAASWGYIKENDNPALWGADEVMESAECLAVWLENAQGK